MRRIGNRASEAKITDELGNVSKYTTGHAIAWAVSLPAFRSDYEGTQRAKRLMIAVGEQGGFAAKQCFDVELESDWSSLREAISKLPAGIVYPLRADLMCDHLEAINEATLVRDEEKERS